MLIGGHGQTPTHLTWLNTHMERPVWSSQLQASTEQSFMWDEALPAPLGEGTRWGMAQMEQISFALWASSSNHNSWLTLGLANQVFNVLDGVSTGIEICKRGTSCKLGSVGSLLLLFTETGGSWRQRRCSWRHRTLPGFWPWGEFCQRHLRRTGAAWPFKKIPWPSRGLQITKYVNFVLFDLISVTQ